MPLAVAAANRDAAQYRSLAIAVAQRVVHLNHATELLLPELQVESRLLHLWRGQSRIRRFFQQPEIQALLSDKSLDA